MNAAWDGGSGTGMCMERGVKGAAWGGNGDDDGMYTLDESIGEVGA